MTKKDYVLEVTGKIQESPRAVLAGHGINPTILKQIAGRPDIIAKLVNFGLMTVNYKKGALGLKKKPNFKITGYKNFAEFNSKARLDVEEFMSKLSDADIEKFTNESNIVTILALPDTNVTTDVSNEIANGKSIVLKFDTSVKKEYRVPGGYYITIMFGDSVIRPADAKKAEAKSAINERTVNRAEKTPALVKSKLEAKAKSKLLKNNKAIKRLENKAAVLTAGVQQLDNAAAAIGAKGTFAYNVTAAKKRQNAEVNKALNGLSRHYLRMYKQAAQLVKDGKSLKAIPILNKIPGLPDVLRDLVLNNKGTAEATLDSRVGRLNVELNELKKKEKMYLSRLESATTAKAKADTRFALRQNSERIKRVREKINSVQGLGTISRKEKLAMLAEVNAKLDALRAKGASITAAINGSVDSLTNVSQEVRQQIKQQIIEQVVNQQTPVEYAVQQAIQQQIIPQVAVQQLPVQQAPAQQAPAQQVIPQVAVQQLPVDFIDDPEFQETLIDPFGNEGAEDTGLMDLIGGGFRDLTDFVKGFI